MSVGPSARPSVRPSIGHVFVKIAENGVMQDEDAQPFATDGRVSGLVIIVASLETLNHFHSLDD